MAEKILLKINHLQDGRYILTIMNNNQIIKKVSFIKTTLKK